MRRLLLLLLLVSGCTKVYTDGSDSKNGSPTSATPVGDVVEYRVTGNVGSALVAVKFVNSVDGTTILPAISLPFVATSRIDEDQTFLLIEANATPVIFTGTTPVLQVQIIVNGRAFREGFAVGVGPLTATASGTWRK